MSESERLLAFARAAKEQLRGIVEAQAADAAAERAAAEAAYTAASLRLWGVLDSVREARERGDLVQRERLLVYVLVPVARLYVVARDCWADFAADEAERCR